MSNTSIIFTGDIGFDKYMYGKWDDADLLSPKIVSFLASCDHLAVNVEGPLYAGGKVSREGEVASLTHSMSPSVARFLSGIGADIWNICNNHIMDAGPAGIESTLDLANEYNAETIGAGRDIKEASAPLILSEAGGIGLIGVGYQRACRKADDDTPGCFSWSDLDRIRETILGIKDSCRWCVVTAHAGEEFTALPSPYTRARYMDYLDMGADIVVAHHPHVVNNYELVGDKAIFYSLGNFIFDTDYQRSQFGTESGVLLKLIFDENTFSFEPFGIKVDRQHGKIADCDLPPIFTNVSAEDYEELKGLAAKVLIENTKRQLRFLRPEEFTDATEEDFYRNFYEPLRSGRVPGETLDMQIIYPLSQTAKKEYRADGTLRGVVDYMKAQLP